MSRPRITLFRGRSSSQPNQPRSAASNASGNQAAGYFQLRRTAGQKSQLEWEFGQEDGARFQLQSTADAPTDGLIVNQPNGTQKRGGANRQPDLEQWQRPTVPSISRPVSARPVSASPVPASPVSAFPVSAPLPRALVGEIVETTSDQQGRRLAAPIASAGPYRNGHVAGTRSALVEAFTGEEGARRVLATRLAIDDALDRWWTNGEHAPIALLRDGLLVLEAGHDLDETQRSFLLRTALRTNRGMVTALRYQIDADRTAFLLKDALLDTKKPFDPMRINDLCEHDEQSAEWLDYLEHDLAYEATVATGKRSKLAAAALYAIKQPSATAALQTDERTADLVAGVPLTPFRHHQPPLLAAMTRPIGPLRRTAQPPQQLRPLSHRWSLRWLLWGVLLLYLLLTYGRPQLGNAAPMVQIPEGAYVVSDPASSDPAASGRFRTVTLAAYAIDRHEVTNAAYRLCWEQNACPIPSSFDSRLRPGYFANRSYDNFPIVNVDWKAANQYCLWVGKRLPTLEEWEVAASLAPATGLRYIYPWGDRFEPRVVNSVLSEPDDTQAVGSYHPAGSTPLGIMDLAGNVAEWTSMPAASMVDGGVVKGGSYRDPPEQLRNDALIEVARDTSAQWLGFRCAVDE